MFLYNFPIDSFMIYCNQVLSDLEDITADHETRLTAAEENIQGNIHVHWDLIS